MHEAPPRGVEAVLARAAPVVAAAGNAGPKAPPLYPAALPGVVAVTAVDRDLAPYRKANRGRHIDLAAPGVDLWAASSGGGGRYVSGTSYAAPFVAAALASAARAEGDGAFEHLRRSARDLGASGADPVFGSGLLQAPPACRR